MSTLEELYMGDISPIEQIVHRNAEYRRLSRKICDEYQYFEKMLSDENKKRFEEWDNMISTQEDMMQCDGFTYGFRLGVMLMTEALTERG